MERNYLIQSTITFDIYTFNPSLSTPVGNTDNEELVYTCKICLEKFWFEKNYQQHCVSHTKPDDHVPIARAPKPNSHLEGKHNGNRQHWDIHTKPGNEVSIAGTTETNSDLDDKYHRKGNFFTCSQCGKGYRDRKNFKSHLKRHSLEGTFICNYCAKRHTNKRSLNCHMRIHTGEKPFKCKNCERCFSHQVSRDEHQYNCCNDTTQRI